jgi:DNA primase
MDIITLAERLGFRLYPGGQGAKKMLCIYHQDTKTPNLTLYRDNNRFFCFACGATGNIYDFYAKVKGITPEQARAELESQNIDIKTTRGRGLHRPEQITQARGRYSEIYKVFIDYLKEQNTLRPDTKALDYLHRTRLLTDETIKQFNLCILPEGKREYQKVKKYIIDRFTLEELRGARIIYKHNTQLQFLRHRIIIPITEDFKIIGLKGKYFYKGTTEAPARRKYTTTARLSGVLFNGDTLRDAQPGDRVILCEGEFDTMIASQEQRRKVRDLDEREPYVTGILSTSYWTEESIRRLTGYDLILALDNDEAGIRARRKIAKTFKEMTGRQASYIKLPAGCDITDYYRSKPFLKE